MLSPRKTAMIAGILYLLTFATSIPALILKTPALEGTSSAGLSVAILLELLLALSCVGTAIVLYPLTRQVSEIGALGFVASRTIEAALVGVGAVTLLALAVIDRSRNADARPVLVALHDATFLVGPGLMPAVNAVLLGSVLYRARLVPRFIPVIGLIGAPFLAASAVATLLGVFSQVSPLAGAAALPIALWEFLIGAWLVIRGFSAPALAALSGVASPEAKTLSR
jgi:hypothetical protein